MPHDVLWRDIHKVDVWELLAFPRGGDKDSSEMFVRESETVERDCAEAK